jgi:hypothetical protein
MMNKRFQHVDQMVETARKTNLAGIHVVFNIILGYPGETEAHRQQTFRIMSDIAKEYSNVSFSPNIFTPYPGIPIWPQLKEMGVYEPQSLAEWETLALVERGRTAKAAAQSRVFPFEQSDSKSDEEDPLGPARCPAAAWCAGALANRQRSLLVSMGTVVIARRRESGHSKVSFDGAGPGGADAGSVLKVLGATSARQMTWLMSC